jgi:hypothetical protein
MDRTAHIQATGHGDPDLSREGHALEVLKKVVHDGLDHGGGIRCRGVAMDVSLGVYDIGQAGARSANGEFKAAGHMLSAFKIFFQGIQFVLAVSHKFNIIPRGKSDKAFTVFVRDIADLPYVLDGHETTSTATDGEALVTRFRDVDQNAGFQDFVIFPLPIVILDYRRKILPEVSRTQIREPVFHGFFRVK